MKYFLFLLYLIGFFLIFDVRIDFKKLISFFSNLLHKEKKVKLADEIKEVRTSEKQAGFLKSIIRDFKLLYLTKKKELNLIYGLAFTFFVLGVGLAILLKNILLIVGVSLGTILIPLIYNIASTNKAKKRLNNEIETALSIITTAYIREENILKAVKMNIDHINRPVKQVFEELIINEMYLSSNTKKAIKGMKGKLSNTIFDEWCDTLVLCIEDKSLKHTLEPIVRKLSDIRTVSLELNEKLYEPFKEYIYMCLLVLVNIPLLYVLNKELFNILIHTIMGKIMISIILVSIFFGLYKVFALLKPIDYRK